MPKILFETADFRLYQCTTDKDYLTMFETPCGSCMVMSPSGYAPEEQRLWQPMAAEHGIHPASWYHFTGYSKGVYLMATKPFAGARLAPRYPLARCMMYDFRKFKSGGREPLRGYGDIKTTSFGATAIIGALMVRVLNLQAIRFPVETPGSFTVPGYLYAGEYYCPLPHCDNNQKDFGVRYDPDSHIFTFIPLRQMRPDERKTVLPIAMTYDWDGYIPAGSVLAAIEERNRPYGHKENAAASQSAAEHTPI